jgi:hypothetical protein
LSWLTPTPYLPTSLLPQIGYNPNTMGATQWVLALLLGVSLAASTGLNVFLPLLLLSLAGRFHVGDVTLGGSFAWLSSDAAIIALSVATVVEIVADKVPALDHLLHVVATVAKPVAGALAASAAMGGTMDLTTAAVVGLIIGAPISLGMHTVKFSTRVLSSSTTAGFANPFVSFVEDILSAVLSLIGIFLPLLVPLALGLVFYSGWKIAKAVRQRFAKGQPAGASADQTPRESTNPPMR